MANAIKRRARGVEKRLRSVRANLMRWLFSGRRRRKLLLDAMPADVVTMTLKYGDHVVTIHPRETIGRRIFTDGHYDRDRVETLLEILEVERLIPEGGMNIVEIGANIGTQALYFCLSGRAARVLAIEPDPRNLPLLRRNIDENGMATRIKVVDCAIGIAERKGLLYRSAGNYGASSLFPREGGLDSVPVAIRPLSDVLAENGIAEDTVDLIWMDIEGAEPEACASIGGLLQRQVPMVMEFSPSIYGPEASEAFIELLARHYRRCLRFDRDGVTPIRISDLPRAGRLVDILLLPDARAED